ncbi:MAG: isopentenyl phosphate kinase [Nitrososphaera sp.]|nr:isopentenyl phosphate kinase [Nitrososphaera sp.]
MQNLALIKLGGSVVTFKDRPVTANTEAIDKISLSLRQLQVPIIIVHGGGSFGHYWSVQYDMHTKPASYDARGVSVVHESMVALNQIIVSSMIAASLNPYGIPPSVITTDSRPIPAKIRQLYEMSKSKVIPVTFGDVVHTKGSRYSILSGDILMTILAKALRPSRVIFATNVDGIFKDLITRELLKEINIKHKSKIRFTDGAAADATGGMRRKVTEAFKIASHGMDVLMVNGLRPERIVEAVLGRPTMGTVVRGGAR